MSMRFDRIETALKAGWVSLAPMLIFHAPGWCQVVAAITGAVLGLVLTHPEKAHTP